MYEYIPILITFCNYKLLLMYVYTWVIHLSVPSKLLVNSLFMQKWFKQNCMISIILAILLFYRDTMVTLAFLIVMGKI